MHEYILKQPQKTAMDNLSEFKVVQAVNLTDFTPEEQQKITR